MENSTWGVARRFGGGVEEERSQDDRTAAVGEAAGFSVFLTQALGVHGTQPTEPMGPRNDAERTVFKVAPIEVEAHRE